MKTFILIAALFCVSTSAVIDSVNLVDIKLCGDFHADTGKVVFIVNVSTNDTDTCVIASETDTTIIATVPIYIEYGQLYDLYISYLGLNVLRKRVVYNFGDNRIELRF